MLYLVTGGSGSGKSEYAEELVQTLCRNQTGREIWYLATMIPYGKETEKKIARHREMRKDKGFLTKECYWNLKAFVDSESEKGSRPICILLECMSNLAANEMFEEKGVGNEALAALKEGVTALCDFCGQVVIVTNEVCSETSKDSPEMLRYKELLGNINCWMGKSAVQVTEVVYGVLVSVKGKDRSLRNRQKNPGRKMVMDKAKRKGLHLIIGGAFQGKTEYVRTEYPDIRWYDGTEDELEEVWEAEGILHLENWLRRWMKAKQNAEAYRKSQMADSIGSQAEQAAEQLIEKNPNRVIVCTEIGYGLVPVDAFERAYREAVGRVCTKLGKKAEKVDRIVCGIKTEIKASKRE